MIGSIRKMIQNLRKTSYIFSALLAILLSIVALFSAAIPFTAYADESEEKKFDETNVLDDLSQATIDGKPFSLDDYGFDKNRSTTVLLFVEYCYSFYFNKQSNFGLYLYVWDPQGISYDVNSSRNTVELSYSNEQDYVKYPLQYLNQSDKSGYEGLFYKYKITLTSQQRSEMLNKLNRNKRVYAVSGVELLPVGQVNPKDYEVNAVYTYSGYAKGYGGVAESELLAYTKQDGEVLNITEDGIKQTFYRATGSNGTNSYTQDTLQSVYFAVPDRYFTQYGTLSEIRAEWLKAKTAWGFLTGTQEYYNAFLECVGYSPSNSSPLWGQSNLPFTDYGLYAPSTADNIAYTFNCTVSDAKSISYLAYVFPTDEWGVDAADDYVVPWSEIVEWMQGYHDNYDHSKQYTAPKPANAPSNWLTTTTTFLPPYNGEYLEVDGVTYGYSKALFESWDDHKTVIDIQADKTFSLTSETVSQNWWQKMFGGSNVVSSVVFDNIEAIHCVDKSDFKASKQLTCDGLYIDTSDYDDFKAFYDNATKNDETVVLLRYDVGEYSALEASEGIPYDGDGSLQGIKSGDTNARLFKMNVYLAFDIISLTFDDGKANFFVLPVVSDPVDTGSAATKALKTTSDKDGKDWWKTIIAILSLILLLVILAPILPYIIKAIVWIVCLPFKLIGALFRAINKSSRRKNGKKEK